MAEPWNVNIHYDGKLDESVPAQAASALDVGCGDGFLASRLAHRISHVVAIDIDRPVLERLRDRVRLGERWQLSRSPARAGAICHGSWPHW